MKISYFIKLTYESLEEAFLHSPHFSSLSSAKSMFLKLAQKEIPKEDMKIIKMTIKELRTYDRTRKRRISK